MDGCWAGNLSSVRHTVAAPDGVEILTQVDHNLHSGSKLSWGFMAEAEFPQEKKLELGG